MTDTAVPVQVALAQAAAAVGAIPKDDVNQQQGFKYRGIERILASVGPALHKAGVVVLPRVVNVHREEMLRGSNQSVWRLVTLTVEYVFVGPGGDTLTAVVLGEGLDNADKAVSKALTMAYKSALLQALQIADADSDPDGTTPPEQTERTRPTAPPTTPSTAPAVSSAEVEAMKPAKVTKALHEAGLDTGGTKEEQRARLADHIAATEPF